MTHPNWKLSPHQLLRKGHAGEVVRLASSDLGEDFQPNRKQRRDYVKHNQSRSNRLHLVGVGSWRKHKSRDYESWAAQTANPVQQAPRRERRAHAIRFARVARFLRRQQLKGQS